jgi:hypothetical protein
MVGQHGVVRATGDREADVMPSKPLPVVALQPSIDCHLSERVDRAWSLLDLAFEERGEGLYVLPEYYLAHLLPDPVETGTAEQKSLRDGWESIEEA